MLTCKNFYEELNSLLDEACAAELRTELEAHMKACPSCYVVFDTTRKTISIFKNQCTEPKQLPTVLKTRLMEALEKKMAEKRATPQH